MLGSAFHDHVPARKVLQELGKRTSSIKRARDLLGIRTHMLEKYVATNVEDCRTHQPAPTTGAVVCDHCLEKIQQSAARSPCALRAARSNASLMLSFEKGFSTSTVCFSKAATACSTCAVANTIDGNGRFRSRSWSTSLEPNRSRSMSRSKTS